MVNDMRAVAIVLVLAALVYLLYLWSKRRDQIPCPSCGARVNIYADKCPHCGHQKGEKVEEPTGADKEEHSGAEDAVEDQDEPAEPEEPAEPVESGSEDDTGDVDYAELVQGTIPEVKHEIMENDLDPEKVLDAEKENKDRVTLKDWLDEQIAQH